MQLTLLFIIFDLNPINKLDFNARFRDVCFYKNFFCIGFRNIDKWSVSQNFHFPYIGELETKIEIILAHH